MASAARRGYALHLTRKCGTSEWRVTRTGRSPKPFETLRWRSLAKTWEPIIGSHCGWGGAACVWVDDLRPRDRPPDLRYGPSWPTCDTGEFFAWLGPRQLLYSAASGCVASNRQVLVGTISASGRAWGISDATAHMILADLTLPFGVRHVLIRLKINTMFY